jgi:WD40 repeat protein
MLNHLNMWDPEEWESELARLVGQLGKELPAPEPVPSCPYPGMRPFTTKESGVFHGRTAVVHDLVDRLRAYPVVAVVGPSGSGKSSLVVAGLYPYLRDRRPLGGRSWTQHVIRPGRRPYDRLAQEFELDPDDGPDVLAARLRTRSGEDDVLLVIDQAEEVFAGNGDGGDAARQIDRLAAVLNSLSPDDAVRVVLTMRADFSADLVRSGLWGAIGSTVYLRPLRGEPLGEAIVKPAEAVGVYVEPRLVERLLADAADEPGLLPFVQETMVMLWGRIERRLLTLAGYEALVIPRSGYPDEPRTGLQVAMATHADMAMARLSDTQRAIARRILLRLVQFGEGRPDVRRQQHVEQLRSTRDAPGDFDDVMNLLVAERLITTDAATGDGEAHATADLSHEALIAGWPALRAWIADHAKVEQARRDLVQDANAWLAAGDGAAPAEADEKPPLRRWWSALRAPVPGAGLLDPVELAAAERWLDRDDAAAVGLDEPPVTDLVDASTAWHRRRARLRFVLTTTFFGLAAVAIVLGAIAMVQGRRATAEANRATALLLATAADTDAEQQDIAALLGLEAVARLDSVAARGGLQTALELSPQLLRYLQGHDLAVRAVAASGDGALFATGGDGGRLLLWDVTDLASPTVLGGHEEEVTTLAFSPDGRYLASGSRDDTVRIWDVRNPTSAPLVLEVTTASPAGADCVPAGSVAVLGDVRTVAFDPASTRLAVGGVGAVVEIWDVGTWRRLAMLEGHSCTVTDAEFSPDGSLLATTSRDDTVRLWDPTTGAVAFQLGTPAPSANDDGDRRAVAWHPEGQVFAVANNDHTVTLHSLVDPASARVVSVHAERVLSLAFSADGALLASGSADRRVNVVAVPLPDGEPRLVAELHGHRDAVRALTFLPDGTLVSGAQDGTVVLWDPERTVRLGSPLAMDSGTAAIARFAGGVIVAGRSDGRLAVWNAESLQPVGESLPIGPDAIRDVAVLGDGRVATGDAGGTLAIIDPTAATVETWRGHDGDVRAIAFVPGANVLVSADIEGVVRLWEPETQRLLDETAIADCPVNDVAADERRILVACNAEDSVELGVTEGRLSGVRTAVATPRLITLTMSDAGELFAGGEDGRVLAWARQSGLGDGAVRIDVDADEVRAVAIDELGRRGALGTARGRVWLWDLEEGLLIGNAWNVGFRIHSLDFSPDGADLVVASADDAGRPDVMMVLDVDEASWRSEACRLAGRNLTDDEWARFVGTDEPMAPCDVAEGG